MASINDYVFSVLENARDGSEKLATFSTLEKNAILGKMADALMKNAGAIITANEIDVANARKENTAESLIDRLRLDEKRIHAMAEDVRSIAKLPDPIGKSEEWKVPNGLKIKKVVVPLGVIAIIYESRPNVTVDVAALAVKSGNACVLRGSTSALNSNRAIVKALLDAVPKGAVNLVDSEDRKAVEIMLHARGKIDVLLPRGGAGLIKYVTENATVPVIETGSGNCHIFVDDTADFKVAQKIIINAKTQRPGVCNAAEKLLVHEKIAKQFLPQIAKALLDKKVELRADEEAFRIIGKSGNVKLATEADWGTEYLGLIIGIKTVKDVDGAIAHINKYNTKHTEAIITKNTENAKKFTSLVDASTVMVNASTRFTDGGEFGFGAELGISTQKMHARGPMGLKELTTYKYIVTGEGQVR